MIESEVFLLMAIGAVWGGAFTGVVLFVLLSVMFEKARVVKVRRKK